MTKIFHHNDLDGYCSAAIFNQFMKTNPLFDDLKSSDFICIDYKDKFPYDLIEPTEVVVIVDYSLPSIEAWDRLLSITNNILWIDHHISAINKIKNTDIENIKGIRRDGTAACKLCWEFLFTDPPPQIVDMLGSYDIWDFSKYGDDLLALQLGVKLEDYTPTDDNWSTWLKSDSDIGRILDVGHDILKYKQSQDKLTIDNFAFYADFEGYIAICCNQALTSSSLFDSVDPNTFDIMMPFAFNGDGYRCSLYTKKDIDCSQLAVKYGGGGHKKAAGFTVVELPVTFIKHYTQRGSV